jgi:hypothetical protein
MEKQHTRMSFYIEVARQFGDLIAEGQYVAAHALLTDEARAEQTSDDLKNAVEKMTSYDLGPIRTVEVWTILFWRIGQRSGPAMWPLFMLH